MVQLCSGSFVIIAQLLLMTAVDSSWIIEQVPRRPYHSKADLLRGRSNYQYDQNTWEYMVGSQKNTPLRKTQAQKHAPLRQTQLQKRLQNTDQPTDNGGKTCSPIETILPNAGIPCDLDKDHTPMFVYFSFDDAITSWNIRFYRQLFTNNRQNPNGCPTRATFFNSHENTEYDLLNELYDIGHEISSHSVSHRGPSTWWSQNATKDDWFDEIVGQRNNINENTAKSRGAGVPAQEVRGMRAPFLALGGDKQFEMLDENDFVYDSSIPNNNVEPSWPFTLHDPQGMNGPICRSVNCPLKPHKVWEAIMNVYYMNETGSPRPCSMVDGCRPQGSRQGAKKFLQDNFDRHYNHRHKIPFGINMHAAWFAFDGYVDAMEEFLDEILGYEDVYIVPIYRLIEWMKQPRTLGELTNSDFGCQ